MDTLDTLKHVVNEILLDSSENELTPEQRNKIFVAIRNLCLSIKQTQLAEMTTYINFLETTIKRKVWKSE